MQNIQVALTCLAIIPDCVWSDTISPFSRATAWERAATGVHSQRKALHASIASPDNQIHNLEQTQSSKNQLQLFSSESGGAAPHTPSPSQHGPGAAGRDLLANNVGHGADWITLATCFAITEGGRLLLAACGGDTVLGRGLGWRACGSEEVCGL